MPQTRRAFVNYAVQAAAFAVLAMSPVMKPTMRNTAPRDDDVAHIVVDSERLCIQELDLAIGECLEACDLPTVLTLSAAFANQQALEKMDLHTLVRDTNPAMHASLQNIAEIFLTHPHLSPYGCKMLREKISERPVYDFRRYLGSMIPDDDDPILQDRRSLFAIMQLFLTKEEDAGLISKETRSRFEQRQLQMNHTLISQR